MSFHRSLGSLVNWSGLDGCWNSGMELLGFCHQFRDGEESVGRLVAKGGGGDILMSIL